jgi:hypothetical protein
MSRKFITFLLLLAMLAVFVPVASGAPSVVLDGRTLVFDVPPTIENGRTLVPLRAIFEALGAQIYWDASTQTVTAQKQSSNTVVSLTIGNQYAYINNDLVKLDVPAKIVNNRTLVPLRFVSEALGAEVAWNGETQRITITSPQEVFEVAHEGQLIGYYSGQMKDGLANGQGVFTNRDGIKFIGQFKNGINIAEWTSGSIQWPDGKVYTGQLKNLKGQGQGKIEWPDGRVYSGSIKDNMADGEGTMIFAPGDRYKKYIGDFAAGKMQGDGSILFADGRIYIGTFTGNEATGKGKIIWPASVGIDYEGEVKNGLMHGQGRLETDEGDVYTGEFKDNLANGQGTLEFADGGYYIGSFENGKPHGQGKMIYPDGTVQDGEWVGGKFEYN